MSTERKKKSIPIVLRDGSTKLCKFDELTTLKTFLSENNIENDEKLVTDEGSCLEDPQSILSEVLDRKISVLYVIRDDKSSKWIRYEVRPHDTVRLIALKFRVSQKVVKKFNPGLVLADPNRLWKKYIFLPTSKVGPDYRDRECMTVSQDDHVPNGLECVSLKRASKEDLKIAEQKRVDIFKVVSGSNHTGVAKAYLSTNKNDLRRALKSEKIDSDWEMSIRKRLSSSSSSSSNPKKVCDLKTGLVRPPGDDPWERWQKHNTTRFVKDNPHGRWIPSKSTGCDARKTCLIQ